MRNKRLGINASKKEKKKKKGHDDKAGAVYPANYSTRMYFGAEALLHFFCVSADRSNLTHLPYEKDAANIEMKERCKAKQTAAGIDNANSATAAVDVEDVRIPEKVEKISTV